MTSKLTVCACALVVLLLLGSNASAQSCGAVYGGYAPSYYAPSYYAPSYGYAAAPVAPSYYAPSYYAPSYGSAASYGSYGYGGYSGYGYGRYGYNPGGLGGPYSGLGVRPGLGLGGFGLRR
jgi:hypothetical protein